jgi:hypothetical protein
MRQVNGEWALIWPLVLHENNCYLGLLTACWFADLKQSTVGGPSSFLSFGLFVSTTARLDSSSVRSARHEIKQQRYSPHFPLQ